jgi:DNA-binding transcriptional MerR regulator
MLTIGELASYAGLTVRAVRHYHAKGLLPEPQRDRSGYRRYDAAAVVELIKIRTLAEAGVPLTRVRELLQADEEEFAAAVADIDTRLRAEIRERQRHRVRIARLAAGDSLALPTEVVEFLDRLRALGVDERIVQVERDGWIPLAARSPERVPEWIARKREQIADPQLVNFYLTPRPGSRPERRPPAGQAGRQAGRLPHADGQRAGRGLRRRCRHRATVRRADGLAGVRQRASGPPTHRAADGARLDRLDKTQAQLGCDQRWSAIAAVRTAVAGGRNLRFGGVVGAARGHACRPRPAGGAGCRRRC